MGKGDLLKLGAEGEKIMGKYDQSTLPMRTTYNSGKTKIFRKKNIPSAHAKSIKDLVTIVFQPQPPTFSRP